MLTHRLRTSKHRAASISSVVRFPISFFRLLCPELGLLFSLYVFRLASSFSPPLSSHRRRRTRPLKGFFYIIAAQPSADRLFEVSYGLLRLSQLEFQHAPEGQ